MLDLYKELIKKEGFQRRSQVPRRLLNKEQTLRDKNQVLIFKKKVFFQLQVEVFKDFCTMELQDFDDQ